MPPENLFVYLVVFLQNTYFILRFCCCKVCFLRFCFFPFFCFISLLHAFDRQANSRRFGALLVFRLPSRCKKQKVRTKSKSDSVRTRYTPAVPPYLKRLTASSHRPPTRSVFLRENYVRNYFVRLGPRGPILSNTVSVGIPPSPTLYRSCVCFLPFNGL